MTKRADLVAAARAYTRRPDPSRLRDLQTDAELRTCQWESCKVVFTPTRPHQTFHSTACRRAAWKAAHPGRPHRRTRAVGPE
ncbi:MAG TPA: hypothetical protein VN803_04070 [Gemmatimonadales bacterium]|nr:hypothetical protein [Gemmatimonadales bacterium]